MKNISECVKISCCGTDGGDFSPWTYSLVSGGSYSNSEMTFTVPCPAGYSCTGPNITITIPPGVVNFRPVDFDPNPPGWGNPWEPQPGTYTFNCGAERLVVTVVGAFTAAQITAILNFLANCQAEAEAKQILAPVPSGTRPRTFSNQAVYYLKSCPAGFHINFSGSLPGWIYVDLANSRLIGRAGTYVGYATQPLANSAAQLALDNFAAAAIIAGTLGCISDEPPPTLSLCIDFDELEYSEDGIQGDAEWTADGDSFDASATVTATPDEVAYAAFRGIVYVPSNIDPINCVVNFTITSTGGVAGGQITALSSFGGDIATINLAGLANGAHQLLFAVPANPSGSQNVGVYIGPSANAGSGGNTGTVHVVGTISSTDMCFRNAAASAHKDCTPPKTGVGGDGFIAAEAIMGTVSQNAVDIQAQVNAQAIADANAALPQNCDCDALLQVSDIPIIPFNAPGCGSTYANGSGAMVINAVGNIFGQVFDAGGQGAYFDLECNPTGQLKITINFSYNLQENAAETFLVPFINIEANINGNSQTLFHDEIPSGPQPGTCKSKSGSGSVSITGPLTKIGNNVNYIVSVKGGCSAIIPNVNGTANATVTLEIVP